MQVLYTLLSAPKPKERSSWRVDKKSLDFVRYSRFASINSELDSSINDSQLDNVKSIHSYGDSPNGESKNASSESDSAEQRNLLKSADAKPQNEASADSAQSPFATSIQSKVSEQQHEHNLPIFVNQFELQPKLEQSHYSKFERAI